MLLYYLLIATRCNRAATRSF